MKKISGKFNPRSVKTPRITQAMVLAVALAASAPYASAANFTWSGATPLTSGSWSTGTNWDTAPVSGSTTTLTFAAATGASGTTTTVNDNSGNFLLNSLNLNGTGAGATYSGTTVISGGVLEFIRNGATNPTVYLNATNATGSNSFLITSNIVLDSDTTFTGNGTGVVNQFNFAGSISGSGNIIKTGNSWLSLSGINNGYAGNVTVNSGKLLFTGVNGTATAWVSSGTLTIASGATAGNSGGVGAFSTLAGGGTLDGGGNRSFTLNYNGVTADTFSGTVQNVLFNKSGTGKVVLSSTMVATQTTAILVNGGELDTPGINGTNTAWMQVNGGVLKFTGTSGNAWSGSASYASTLAGGTLAIAPTGTGANVVVTGGTASIANGMRLYNGILLLDKGGNNSLTFMIGSSVTSAATVTYGGYNFQATLKAASGLDNLGSATGEKLVALAPSSTYAPQLTNNMTTAGMIGQDADANLSGDFLTYVGTGLATDTGFKRYDYSASNSYADTNFAASGNTKVESVTTAQSLAGTTNAVYALKNSSVITLTAGSKLTVGSTAASSTNGIILNGGSIVGAGTLSLAPSTGNTCYIYSSLAGGTISTLLTVSQNLVVSGPGVLTYNGASSFGNNVFIGSGATLDVPLSQLTGVLYLNGGVLQANGSLTKSLGTNISLSSMAAGGGFAARGGNLTVNLGGSATPSTLTWNNSQEKGGTAGFVQDGGSLFFGSQTADSAVIFKNNIDLGGNTSNFSRVISVYDNVNSTTDLARITGVISSTADTNQLVKDGAGTLILEAANTYKGSTFISAGTLQLGYGGATGSLSTSSAIVDNGVFAINRSNAVTQGIDFSGAAITGTGAFVQAGAGVTTLTAANTYTGVTTVSAGTLKVDGSIVSGTVNVTGATLAGSGTASGKVNVTGGTISGNGLHLGVTTLKGVNNLNGTTTASSITVADGSTTVAGSVTSTAALSVSVGATLINTGTIHGDVNVDGLLQGTGAVDGALTLNGTLGLGVTGTTTAGVDYDQISVSGNVTLGGALNFTSLSGLSAMGDKITLILNTNDAAITSGAFSSISLNGVAQTVINNTFTVGTTEYLIDYNAVGDNGIAENDVLLTVVPEPSTWAMILGGLGLLIGVQRIQRSNRKRD